MSFLKAEWRKLIMANYVIDPSILKKYIPHGTELDLWQGKCYVSLIGFMFQNTRLLGVPIPFHRNFEEVNLRFYVRYNHDGDWKRGVVFIKEIVPKWALTFVANSVYKEHYETMKMSHQWEENAEKLTVAYRWLKGKSQNSLQVEALPKPMEIVPDSETEFIAEHYWGYVKAGECKTLEYEVTHPKWKVYPVLNHQIEVDFKNVYGTEFGFLYNEKPANVFLAEGSDITVEGSSLI